MEPYGASWSPYVSDSAKGDADAFRQVLVAYRQLLDLAREDEADASERTLLGKQSWSQKIREKLGLFSRFWGWF